MATQTFTLRAGTAAWSTGADWSPGPAPGSADTALFAPPPAGTPAAYAVSGPGSASSLTIITDTVMLTGAVTVASTASEAAQIGETGTLVIAAGASLSVAGDLSVGYALNPGTGFPAGSALLIDGQVSSANGHIGILDTGAGAVTIDGGSAGWTIAGELDAYGIGGAGLQVSNGATLSDASATVNFLVTTLTGPNALWSSQALTLGSSSPVSVLNGATLASASRIVVPLSAGISIDGSSHLVGTLDLNQRALAAVADASFDPVTLSNTITLNEDPSILVAAGEILTLNGTVTEASGEFNAALELFGPGTVRLRG